MMRLNLQQFASGSTGGKGGRGGGKSSAAKRAAKRKRSPDEENGISKQQRERWDRGEDLPF